MLLRNKCLWHNQLIQCNTLIPQSVFLITKSNRPYYCLISVKYWDMLSVCKWGPSQARYFLIQMFKSPSSLAVHTDTGNTIVSDRKCWEQLELTLLKPRTRFRTKDWQQRLWWTHITVFLKQNVNMIKSMKISTQPDPIKVNSTIILNCFLCPSSALG